MDTQNGIINTGFFYLKKDSKSNFEKFRNRAHVILEQYGGRIERIIKPNQVKGELELPDEIHFAYYPSVEAKEKFDTDPDFLKLKKEYAATSIEKMFGFITNENPNLDFYREHGDTTKTFAIALVYLKEGKESYKQFANYQQEVSTILPEFGIHFERFLIPFAAANDAIKQPNEIHRVYFDIPDSLQKMNEDSRMQALFPKRDESLENLVFIIGEAIS